VTLGLSTDAARLLRTVGGALVGGLVFVVGMFVVAVFSPLCCIDPRSVEGVAYVLETVAAGLVAGLAASRAAGASARGAGIVLATGILGSALLIGPGGWQVERFTLVFVAPLAVLLGAVAGHARHRASPPATH